MPIENPPAITPAPTPPPQRGDRDTFSDRVDAFVVWVSAAGPQFEGVAANVRNNAIMAQQYAAEALSTRGQVFQARDVTFQYRDSAAASATSAQADRVLASNRAGDALASAQAAAQSAADASAVTGIPSITGNATKSLRVNTAGTAMEWVQDGAALGFTPVQQGGGAGQDTAKVYLGHATGSSKSTKITVGSADAGYVAMSSTDPATVATFPAVAGNGAQLTGFTAAQLTTALGYTPANAAMLAPGQALEAGRYIDLHAENSNNDFDARLEVFPTTGGNGSSAVRLRASQLEVTGPVSATYYTGDVSSTMVTIDSAVLSTQDLAEAQHRTVEQFGAVPAAEADSSGAFVAASAAGMEIVCNGTYLLNTLPDNMDWRNFSGSGTATIKGKLFTFAYIKKPKFSFDEIRGRIAFTHPGDFEVKLAFYGDSIVDGANTVSAVNNPVDAQGRAIGTSNHTLTNAGAFSNRLLGLFQELSATFGKPNRVRVWNAGYSGKSAITGWANENYERAVILNPQYGSPDAVGIEFSINDSYANGPSTANSPNLYAAEMKKLMAKIQGYGAVPFMITPPQIFAVAGYDSRIISGVYDQIKKGLASAVPGVAYLDMGAAVARWYNAGMDGNGPNDPPLSGGFRTASLMYQMAQAGAADRTHPADRTHRFMAGYLFSQMAPNMFITSRDRYESVSAADYRWRLNVIDSGAGTSVAVPKLSQHGGNVVALAGQYTGGQQWNTAWIWNDQPDAYLVYRAGDVNGSKSGQPYVATAEAGTLTVIDKCGGLFSYQERLPNDGAAPFAPAPTSDRPHVICQLAHGLNFVSLTAPTSNAYDYFPGALEVSIGLTHGYGASTWTDYVATRNLLSECGPIYKSQTTGGRVYGVEESLGGANWVDFGRAGKTTSLLLEMEITGVGSLGITCGAGASHRRVNGALYRDNATQLKLVLFTEAFDGTANTYLIQAFPYTKTGLQRIRLDMGRDATGNQLIRLYDGWSDVTQIGEWISNNGASPAICWPWAGHFGDHVLQGATTIECKSATITYT